MNYSRKPGSILLLNGIDTSCLVESPFDEIAGWSIVQVVG
jgi:hypothetical protein